MQALHTIESDKNSNPLPEYIRRTTTFSKTVTIPITPLLLYLRSCPIHWNYLRLDFYCFLHPFPLLLGEAPQDNFWLSCPTVPEIGGRAESLNGQQTSREERCHFPFWHEGRLRYECVELDTTSSTSSSSQVAYLLYNFPYKLCSYLRNQFFWN